MALVIGGAKPGDVVNLTRLFDAEIVHVFPEPMDDLDRQYKTHLTYVFNQSIQNLRATGWSRETLVKVGELLLRLWKVTQAYKSQKPTDLAGWIERLISTQQELEHAFSDVPGASV